MNRWVNDRVGGPRGPRGQWPRSSRQQGAEGTIKVARIGQMYAVHAKGI